MQKSLFFYLASRRRARASPSPASARSVPRHSSGLRAQVLRDRAPHLHGALGVRRLRAREGEPHPLERRAPAFFQPGKLVGVPRLDGFVLAPRCSAATVASATSRFSKSTWSILVMSVSGMRSLVF